jgi:hypothetical protein
MSSSPRQIRCFAGRWRVHAGGVALVMPRLFALRMFGVGTLLIGLDLLSGDPGAAARVAPRRPDRRVGHGLGSYRQPPARAAKVATAVSG